MESLDTHVHARDGARAASRARPGAALVLGRYRIVSRLGAGGFGVVFSAHDEVLDRPVAVKRIALPEGASGDRAVREALAAARLAHPAIVSLYEACAEADSFVIVSELIEGRTLASLIASGSLSDEAIAEIGLALADALQHAHGRGVIHRDVKPQNVLVPDRPDEGGAPAKLADFGGARLAGEETLTRSGDVVGTLAYMAPEQAAAGEAAEEADLYSLALVLFEAFAGVNPVRGPTPAATARRLGGRLPSLAQRRRDLPRELTRAVDIALDPRPHRRRSLQDLADGLDEALEAGLSARVARGRGARQPAADPGVIELGHDSARRTMEQHPPAAGSRPPARFSARRAYRPLEAPGEPPAWAPAPAPGAFAQARRPLAEGDRGAGSAVAAGLSLRAACALPAGALAAIAVSLPLGGHPPTLAAPVAAAIAAGAVGLAPRAGWVALSVAIATWAAAAGHAGAAVLVIVGSWSVAVLLRRPGPAWSAPALAPLLGSIGLAGVYPALAGQAAGWRRRAAVGALGYWWLCLAEPLTGHRLWLGPPAGVPTSPSAWDSSALRAVEHVVWPLLGSGTLLGMLLWAAGAALLPWLVAGRSLALDIVAATFWSVALYTAAPLLDRGLAGHSSPPPHGALAGALLAGTVAVAARSARRPRAARRAQTLRRRGSGEAVSRAL